VLYCFCYISEWRRRSQNSLNKFWLLGTVYTVASIRTTWWLTLEYCTYVDCLVMFCCWQVVTQQFVYARRYKRHETIANYVTSSNQNGRYKPSALANWFKHRTVKNQMEEHAKQTDMTHRNIQANPSQWSAAIKTNQVKFLLITSRSK